MRRLESSSGRNSMEKDLPLVHFLPVKNKLEDAVAHTCKTYLGGRDREGHGLRPDWAKKFTMPPSELITGYGGTCLSSQLYGKYK
jgi:hypothetical protein